MYLYSIELGTALWGLGYTIPYMIHDIINESHIQNCCTVMYLSDAGF